MDDYKKRQAMSREWSRKARKADTSVKHGMRAEMTEEKKKANAEMLDKKKNDEIAFLNGDTLIEKEKELELIRAVEGHIGQTLVEPVITYSHAWAHACVVEGRAIVGPAYDQKYAKVAFCVSADGPKKWKIVDLSA